MEKPEKFKEAFSKTLIRTVITATIIAAILFFAHAFPSGDQTKLNLLIMIWLMVYIIVLGGHLLELIFINYLKFVLPKNIILLYVIRIAYWFLCAIPLIFGAGLIHNLFVHKNGPMVYDYTFGVFYIGIELFMHAMMQIRFRKSFYNGVY